MERKPLNKEEKYRLSEEQLDVSRRIIERNCGKDIPI